MVPGSFHNRKEPMERDQTAKMICLGLAIMAGLYALLVMLPYIELFLALCGAWHLWQEHQKGRKR